MYASGPCERFIRFSLRGNYYNREASNIKYDDGKVVSTKEMIKE